MTCFLRELKPEGTLLYGKCSTERSIKATQDMITCRAFLMQTDCSLPGTIYNSREPHNSLIGALLKCACSPNLFHILRPKSKRQSLPVSLKLYQVHWWINSVVHTPSESSAKASIARGNLKLLWLSFMRKLVEKKPRPLLVFPFPVQFLLNLNLEPPS